MKEEKFLISKKPKNKKSFEGDANDVDKFNCIRPKILDQFIGQERILQQILVLIDFAKKNNCALPHMIFYGQPGTGKTSLANILANEIGSKTISLTCPSVDKISKLVGVLMNIGLHQILFLDEIHALSRPLEEILYSAMEDFVLDLIIDNKDQKHCARFDLPKFTLIGATTRLSKITKPLLSRFSHVMHFVPYSVEELSKIIFMNANIMNIQIDQDSVNEISKRSRSSPRQAKHILNWIKSFINVNEISSVKIDIVYEAFDLLGIDDAGLNENDITFLRVLTDSPNKPIGLSTLAAVIGEDSSTIEDVYEPYLMSIGMIRRTQSGRVATEKAYNHLMKKSSNA